MENVDNEEQNKTERAIQHLSKALNSDLGYRFAWQSNIAIQFQDELSRRGYKLPDQHEISNVAADNFLNLLTKKNENL